MLREEKEQGKTVFMSSHVMSEVEATCDRVGIIRDGELVTLDTVSHLTELSLWTVEVAFADPVDGATCSTVIAGVSVTMVTDRSLVHDVS